ALRPLAVRGRDGGAAPHAHYRRVRPPRRPARPRARARHDHHDARVGLQRVLLHLRGSADRRRPPGRYVRPPPGGLARADRVHRRLDRGRHRAVDRLADCRPCAPGPWNRAQLRRLGLRGFVVLTVGLVLVVLGVRTSGQSGWGSPLVVVSVLAGLAAIALFLMLEPRVRTPLIEFALFRNRVFMGTLLIHFSWNWVWSVFMFLLTLYLQHVRDLSPLQTGVLYLGFALPFVIGSSVAGKV